MSEKIKHNLIRIFYLLFGITFSYIFIQTFIQRISMNYELNKIIYFLLGVLIFIIWYLIYKLIHKYYDKLSEKQELILLFGTFVIFAIIFIVISIIYLINFTPIFDNVLSQISEKNTNQSELNLLELDRVIEWNYFYDNMHTPLNQE